jgi:hypothetical protein
VSARYAIYFVPEQKTALALLGSALLGRDSETGNPLPPARLAGITQQILHGLTTDARRYGLHATLKAPFFLKKGTTEYGLLLSAASFVMGRQAITLPRLELARIGSFFALVPPEERPEALKAVERIKALAADAVVFFDPFRATPSEQELARREPQKLTDRQRALLIEWGYPYVFDEYRFHITLTDKLRDSREARRIEECLRAYFTPVRNEEMIVSNICVCRQITSDPASIADAHPDSNGSAFMPIMRFGFQ